MSRDRQQAERFNFERRLLSKYIPTARFNDYGSHVWVEARFTPQCSRTEFVGRLLLEADYPFRQPDLYIVEPRELPLFRSSTTLRDLGTSHDFHVNASDATEGVKVCFTKNWDASHTCVKIFMKLVLFLEAYDEHLRCGKTIAELLYEIEAPDTSGPFYRRLLESGVAQNPLGTSPRLRRGVSQG